MSRRIRTIALQSASGQETDTFFDRVIKYIPADVVGGWVAVTGIAKSNAGSSTILWAAFVFGLVITAIWTYMQTREAGKPSAVTQIVIATAAFVVWVAALGDPFSSLAGYRQYYGSLLLIGFTLAVGLVVPKE